MAQSPVAEAGKNPGIVAFWPVHHTELQHSYGEAKHGLLPTEFYIADIGRLAANV